MGAPNANGVWIYDETDMASPFSDYSNLGQQSVSDAISTLKTANSARLEALELSTAVTVGAITASTNWQSNVVITAQGKTVTLDGTLYPLPSMGNVTIPPAGVKAGTLPSWARPARTQRFRVFVSQDPVNFECRVLANGEIWYYAASPTTTLYNSNLHYVALDGCSWVRA